MDAAARMESHSLKRIVPEQRKRKKRDATMHVGVGGIELVKRVCGGGDDQPLWNLYSVTQAQQAIREWARAMRDWTGNLPPLYGALVHSEASAHRLDAVVRSC